jgi:hypothetical protein
VSDHNFLSRAVLPLAVLLLAGGCRRSDTEEMDYPWVEKGHYGLCSHPLVRTTPDASAGALRNDDLLDPNVPFAFALAVGGFGEYTVLYLHEDGACDCRFPATGPGDARGWEKRTLIKLSTKEMMEVRCALSKSNFLALSGGYDAGLADGTDLYLECRLGERSKIVQCYNHFPDPVVEVSDLVIGRFLEPHRAGARSVEGSRFSVREFFGFVENPRPGAKSPH